MGLVNAGARMQVLVRASAPLLTYVCQGWKAHWRLLIRRAGKLTAKICYMYSANKCVCQVGRAEKLAS
jgi:hypothetical protein